MAITDQLAVKFANEKCRVIADLSQQLYRTIDQFLQDITTAEWEANPDVIAAADGDLINDGSNRDGRKPVTKIKVAQLKFVTEQLKGTFETDDRLALLNNWVTNGLPKF